MIDKEIATELAKNRADEIIVKKELDLVKQRLIDEINNGLGNEMKTSIIDNKPIRYRKPFGLKIKEFFKRISKTLGN